MLTELQSWTLRGPPVYFWAVRKNDSGVILSATHPAWLHANIHWNHRFKDDRVALNDIKLWMEASATKRRKAPPALVQSLFEFIRIQERTPLFREARQRLIYFRRKGEWLP